MHRNRIVELVVATLALFSLVVVISCGSSGGVGVRWGGGQGVIPEEPPAAGKGPPPWAPAHGHRAKHRYLYFPKCPAYYDTNRSVYFFMEGETWTVSAELPDGFSMKLDEHVLLEMDTDKPYTRYNEHKRKYPPGKAKKKGNQWAHKGKK
jgi:hypothetical protein